MRKSKKWIGWLLLPVVVVCVMFAVEGVCNWTLLRLPAEQKGVFTLDLNQGVVAVEPTDEHPDPGFVPESFAEAGYIDLSDPTFTVTVPFTGYVDRLHLFGDASEDVSYLIVCTDESGAVRAFPGNMVAFSTANEITLGASVTSIRLQILEGSMSLTGLEVASQPSLNPYRMLISALCTLGAGLLVLLSGVIAKKAEYGFLIVALCAGLILSLCQPTGTVLCYDDHIHFQRVWTLATGYEDSLSIAATDLTIGTNYTGMIDSAYDQAQLYAAQDTEEQDAYDTTDAVPCRWQLNDVGYVGQAAGLWLGRTLGLPFHVQVLLSRTCNLLGYVALCFCAIRVLKRFKIVLATVALLPTPLFLASSFSYDPTCMGLSFLGIALVMSAILDREKPLSWQRALGILVSFTLAGMVKAVYLPLMLLVLLLPRTKFATSRQRVAFKSMAMVLFAAALASILISIGSDISVIEDTRGYGVDSGAQIQFILTHPFTYLGYFFSALWNDFDYFLLTSYRTTFAYLGNMGDTWSSISLLVMCFAVFTDNDPALGQRLTWKQRLAMLLIAGVAVGLVFTTMYVAFTAVGASTFEGVQGRYLLPILPLVFMLLSPDGLHNSMNKRSYHMALFLANGVILVAQGILLVFIPYCL